MSSQAPPKDTFPPMPSTPPLPPALLARPRPFKRALDLAVASLLLIALAPLLGLIAVLVRLTTRGPALYSQIRVGKGGKPFRIYKFRSMYHECEKWGGIRWSGPGDNRVTFVGYYLRLTHLDELPQLFNVLVGQMSLVGPRPERPEFVPDLTRHIPMYSARLAGLPGVTGLAQLFLPADTDLESVRRKVVYDLWYITRGTLWLDLRLIFCTALKVVRVPMPGCCRHFRIPDPGQFVPRPPRKRTTLLRTSPPPAPGRPTERETDSAIPTNAVTAEIEVPR